MLDTQIVAHVGISVQDEDRLVPVLDYSPFKQITTSVFRRVEYGFLDSQKLFNSAERRSRVNKDSLLVQYSIAAQPVIWKSYDVTSLVPTERLRNKYSFLVSFLLQYISTAQFNENVI